MVAQSTRVPAKRRGDESPMTQ